MPSHRVAVVGGGFAGLQAALHLRDAAVEVTLIDRRNFHLFQPLTYQVATGALASGEVAYPLRAIFKGQAGVRVLMGEVRDFDLTLPGHPEILALGDMVRMRDRDGAAQALPGVAPVAMQQGRYAARAVLARLEGRPVSPFRYRDKGNLATIGRARAVADIRGVRLSGVLAWITWLVVHLFYLVGFQNRILVLIRWSFSFLTRGRGARLIAGGPAAAADAPE